MYPAQVRQLPAAAEDDDVDRPLAAPWAPDSCLVVLFEVALSAAQQRRIHRVHPPQSAAPWAYRTRSWAGSAQGLSRCKVTLGAAAVLPDVCSAPARAEGRVAGRMARG